MENAALWLAEALVKLINPLGVEGLPVRFELGPVAQKKLALLFLEQ